MLWKKLILIGDSNTQFGYGKEGAWVSLVSEMLQRKCDVINRGFSGYNTQNIRKFLPNILKEFNLSSICGIIVFLGTNDSALKNSIQHVSLEQYVDNLEWILNYLINECKLNKDKLIFICPGRIDDETWKKEEENLNENSKLLDELVADYAKECSTFCIRNNLNFINLYELMSIQCENNSDSFKELFYDGLHFSAQGGLLLFNNLRPMIEKFILNDLQENYPDWKQLSAN
jgi:isoamyl acetate esterase